MKNLRRIVWTRGMFLTPQHFQSQDNLIDDTLQFRFMASHFANWGVVALRVDPERLANGQFTLSTCRGVLPDGTIFSSPDPDPAPAGRPIGDSFPPDQTALDVFLALPDRHSGAQNFTQPADVPPQGVSTRYIADTVEVVDENGYDEQKSIQLARKNFRLMFGTQSLDGFVTMRIARVLRNDAGGFVLDPAFVAPCLDIASNEYLINLLRREIELLVSKAEVLKTGRRQRGQSLADFNTAEAATFWLLHTVNSHLPELQHIRDVRHGHPEALWTTLLRLAGALSTFSLDPKAGDSPQYNHENLGGCFTALDEKIRGFLETVIPSKFASIPLRLLEQSLWTGTVSDDAYFKNAFFYLAVSAKVGLDELINMVLQRVKIAAGDDINDLIRLALPGITLHHVPTPPSAIPLKLNNQYFTLNQTGRLWERVTQSRSISVYIPPQLAEARPEILVVLQ